MNSFNIMTLGFPALRTEAQPYQTQEEENPINTEKFDISDVPTLSVGVSTVDAWQTSSGVGTFDKDEPQRISTQSSPSSTRPSPRRQKRKLITEKLFLKKRECRRMSVKTAVKLCQRKDIPRLRVKLEKSCKIF